MSFVTPSGGGGGTVVEQSVRVNGPATYNVSATDQKMICDCTGGNIIVNIPTAVAQDGRVLTIKKIDVTTNTVAIIGPGAQTIDYQPNYVISISNDSISVEADSGNWWIV